MTLGVEDDSDDMLEVIYWLVGGEEKRERGETGRDNQLMKKSCFSLPLSMSVNRNDDRSAKVSDTRCQVTDGLHVSCSTGVGATGPEYLVLMARAGPEPILRWHMVLAYSKCFAVVNMI